MAVDPSNLTTITIDRETYEVLLESYNTLADIRLVQHRAQNVRILTDQQFEELNKHSIK